MRAGLRWSPSLALLLVLALGGAARSEVTNVTVNKCLSRKLRSVGSSAGARAACYSKAAKKGALPGACLDQASARFTGGERPERGAFAKLEAKGSCLTQEDGPIFDGDLAAFASALNDVVGAGTPSRCDAAKLKCAARYVAGVMGCYVGAAAKSGAVDASACLDKRLATFSDGSKSCYEKAVALGDCSNSSAADAARGVADGFVADSICALDPSGGVPAPQPGVDPLDTFLGPCALRLTGVSPHAFNPLSASLHFNLAGVEFSAHPEDVELSVNGSPVAAELLSLGPHTITADSVLVDGRNDISFAAVDGLGRPVYLKRTVWAGSNFLSVDLVDEDGAPFTDTATVRASLTDDQSVFVEATTGSSSVQFENVPSRTILARASAGGNRSGVVGFVGTQGSVQIRLVGFHAPSPVDNNDFSQGTDGWEVGSAPVAIAPHVEGNPGQALAARDLAGNDLTLSTSGEGEQSISRSFEVEPGTTSIRVRYRFVTSEVPGGYFGSQYNDYFRVSLRSEFGGGSASESNSMNGLGLDAFDFQSGATAWRELTLPVDKQGDTVQVDIGVANVADEKYDSSVIVDFVDEDGGQIRPSLAWNRNQGGLDLSFRVENGPLNEDAVIEVYFASGPSYAERLGGAVFTHAVPAGTPEGQHGPVHVAGDSLADDPDGTAYLIAAVDETHVGSLADVQVGYGANADADVVWSQTLDVIRDGLRAAGQASATINSTARSPADQARAMFNNLTNPDHTTQQNIDTQLGIYAAPGDAVIQVFADQVDGMTPTQITQNAGAIQTAMETEIDDQGPGNVSHHCADPAQLNVVDVGAGAFNATNGALFVASVQGRVSRFIDERNTNGCYHLEVQ